jgi:hypothetical protein
MMGEVQIELSTSLNIHLVKETKEVYYNILPGPLYLRTSVKKGSLLPPGPP